MARIKMVGRDVDTSPTQHRTWVVEDQIDSDGYYYTGPKGGSNPLVDIYAYAVPDGRVVNFNLPNITEWIPTYRTLPEATCDSHLLVMDGYIYMFGGRDSDSILFATTGDPAYWRDTHANLPSKLGGGQLAVIGDYTYIFGGSDGYDGYYGDKVFSAPNSDLLTWTDHGSKLPGPLVHSHLFMDDGYVYLISGNDGYASTDVMYYASLSDPLTWVDSGITLPFKLEGSHLAVIEGYVYLFGGIYYGTPTTKIWRSPVAGKLTSWSYVGDLPTTAHFGQFVTIGSKGYIFAIDNTTPQTYSTKIFECSLGAPTVWIQSYAINYDTIPLSINTKVINESVSQSQFAFVGDRVFMFGGNGSSAIYTHTYDTVFSATDAVAISYGDVTRIQYQNVTDGYDKFRVLCYPYWKTDYSVYGSPPLSVEVTSLTGWYLFGYQLIFGTEFHIYGTSYAATSVDVYMSTGGGDYVLLETLTGDVDDWSVDLSPFIYDVYDVQIKAVANNSFGTLVSEVVTRLGILHIIM